MVHLRDILLGRRLRRNRFAGGRSRPCAFAALVAALAVALAPFLSELHLSLVEHQVCDAHSAVEHGPGHGDDQPGPEDRSDHDACSIPLMGPVSGEVTADAVATLDLPTPQLDSRIPAPPDRPRDRVWLRAPKGSPPA